VWAGPPLVTPSHDTLIPFGRSISPLQILINQKCRNHLPYPIEILFFADSNGQKYEHEYQGKKNRDPEPRWGFVFGKKLQNGN